MIKVLKANSVGLVVLVQQVESRGELEVEVLAELVTQALGPRLQGRARVAVVVAAIPLARGLLRLPIVVRTLSHLR